jgi:hypothetical protein
MSSAWRRSKQKRVKSCVGVADALSEAGGKEEGRGTKRWKGGLQT